MIPFTQDQFFEVFENYNQAVWPMQGFILALGLLAVVFATGRFRGGHFAVSLVLSFFWIWMGVVYHFRFFSTVNRAAFFFGGLFVLEGILFLLWGLFQGKILFRYRNDWRGLAGVMLLTYSILAYPLLGSALGHHYPVCPTFGLPCPTTLFTIGLLCWVEGKQVRGLLVIPLLWSLVGLGAAFSFRVFEDLGLLVAAGVGLLLLVKPGEMEESS